MNIQRTHPKKDLIQTSAFGVPEYKMMPAGVGYMPQISPEQLSGLRLLKAKTNRPITKLMSEAPDLFFLSQG
jgi:hypothetical protein